MAVLVKNSSVPTNLMEKLWEILSSQLCLVLPEEHTIASSNHESKECYLEDSHGLPARVKELGSSCSRYRKRWKELNILISILLVRKNMTGFDIPDVETGEQEESRRVPRALAPLPFLQVWK